MVSGITDRLPSYAKHRADSYSGSSELSAKRAQKAPESHQLSGKEEQAYLYEKTDRTFEDKAPYKLNKMTKEERAVLVEKMKKDLEARKAEFLNLVTKTLTGQGKAVSLANGDKDGIWKILAKGDFTVDAATKKQAMKDISEEGYFGVKKTAERLFDFASALAGNDPKKMKEMQDAMKKGFEAATKAWGKKLPEISKKTLDEANKLFDSYFEGKEPKKVVKETIIREINISPNTSVMNTVTKNEHAGGIISILR